MLYVVCMLNNYYTGWFHLKEWSDRCLYMHYCALKKKNWCYGCSTLWAIHLSYSTFFCNCTGNGITVWNNCIDHTVYYKINITFCVIYYHIVIKGKKVTIRKYWPNLKRFRRSKQSLYFNTLSRRIVYTAIDLEALLQNEKDSRRRLS